MKIIKNINEVNRYKNELSQIKIWVCSAACGKTYLSSIDNRFYDLDYYRTQLFIENKDNKEELIINKMNEMLLSNKIILNAPQKDFVKYLVENKIPFVFMYGKPEVEKEYKERMKQRGSTTEFIKNYGNIKERYKLYSSENIGTFKIEMSNNEYVSDYIYKVFEK